MNHENTLIQKRRREVDQQIARHRQAISALEAELPELEMAERVFLRLSGATGSVVGSGNAIFAPPVAIAGTVKKMTMNEMIMAVLSEALHGGMLPKDVTSVIRERWRPDVSGTYVSTSVWRLAQSGDLEKEPNGSRYRIPQMKEADDPTPATDWSTASLFETQAKGREAVPGGGG